MNADAARGRRVLILVENLPVPFDRRVWMQSTALHANGYQVSVICPKGKGYEKDYEEIDGVHIYRHVLQEAKSAKGYLHEYATALWAQWKLAHRVRRERGFDVIHACNPPDLMFLIAGWFKLFHRKRFIFDHHDLCPELYESKYERRDLLYRVMLLVERLTFACANVVISTNQSYRSVAIERGGKSPHDVFVVRSGPNLAKFNPVPPDPAFKQGRRYLVGYLGVMGPQDGLDHLVKAARELIIGRGRDDIQFCLVGGGSELETLKAMAKELGVADRIEFTGRISDQDMIARLSTCDVCVNPDPMNPLNDKSTMNKILEYMALERPIVQYDLLEGRRSAGDASIYAQPNNITDLADKIAWLLEHPDHGRAMGLIGRQRMEKSLQWTHQVPKLLAAYRRALS
jgi:glycosyltransferase involved in cell wall biosynthesis